MLEPKLKRDWHGRYVRLKGTVETRGGIILEAGEVMRVTRNHGGLDLEAVIQCDHCNRNNRRFVRKLQERSVVLLPADFVPNDPRPA